jgi:ubiquinone/menaquinone biosynthesis C-methylase UbiE
MYIILIVFISQKINNMPEFSMEEPPGKILKDVVQDYEEEKGRGASFNVSRGLYRNDTLHTEGYLDTLPTFEGSNFVQLVDFEIQKRKTEAQTTGEPYQRIRIVDVGYGQGRMLLDCFTKWGEDVELIGYGNDYYTKAEAMADDGLKLPPTKDQIEHAGIRLVSGNIVDIRRELGDNCVDFLVCCNTLQWVNYPKWEMVKKFFRVLKDKGVALIDSVGIKIKNGQQADLVTYLRNSGYSFEIGLMSISFKKEQEDISLPIRSVGSVFDETVTLPKNTV